MSMPSMVMCVIVGMVVIVMIGMRMLVTMPVSMPFAIRPGLRLESSVPFGDDQVHAAQHLGQHRVGLELQAVALHFELHMAVTQVVGGAGQVSGGAVLRAGAHLQHRLRRGFDAQERPVLRHQHVAPTQHRATRQEHRDVAARAVVRVEAAFAAGVPVQGQRGGASAQGRGQAATGGKMFVGGEHGEFTVRRRFA